jgi:DNA-binding beta-propeller fold protein YncE
MVHNGSRIGTLVLRLNVGLALLGWPRVGSAQGTWSVISLPQKTGEVVVPQTVAVDATGNLYVADYSDNGGRVQKRDAQGNWTVIATAGTGVGQVEYPSALAVDRSGNLYVADTVSNGGCGARTSRARIQKRDAQGNWSVIATGGSAVGQVGGPSGLAVDAAGTLYVADTGNNRVLKYSPEP